jgi:hypothetical protein
MSFFIFIFAIEGMIGYYGQSAYLLDRPAERGAIWRSALFDLLCAS